MNEWILQICWFGPLSGAALAAFVYFVCLDSVDRNNTKGRSLAKTKGELKLGHLIVRYTVPPDQDDQKIEAFPPPYAYQPYQKKSGQIYIATIEAIALD